MFQALKKVEMGPQAVAIKKSDYNDYKAAFPAGRNLYRQHYSFMGK